MVDAKGKFSEPTRWLKLEGGVCQGRNRMGDFSQQLRPGNQVVPNAQAQGDLTSFN